MLQQTILRLAFMEKIVIVTNDKYRPLVEEQIKDLPGKIEILTEPCRRNTGPAIALAMRFLEDHAQGSPNEAVLVVPSDHFIGPEEIFCQTVQQMENLAKQGKIVTFGIRPTKPETGYGYIRVGSRFAPSVFIAEKFVEKPDIQKAREYVQDPLYYWNSGMFLFSGETFWKELGKHAPKLLEGVSGPYDQMPDISIDYAIMEKSREILVCPLAVSWSDIGSWDSLYDVLAKDDNQNVKMGNVVDIETKNSLIISGKKTISTIGVEDLLIVETEDSLFISKRGESQKVKNIVAKLMKANS